MHDSCTAFLLCCRAADEDTVDAEFLAADKLPSAEFRAGWLKITREELALDKWLESAKNFREVNDQKSVHPFVTVFFSFPLFFLT